MINSFILLVLLISFCVYDGEEDVKNLDGFGEGLNSILGEDETAEDIEFVFGVGEVIFYLIIAVSIILILLVIWLIVLERNMKNDKNIRYSGFGTKKI